MDYRKIYLLAFGCCLCICGLFMGFRWTCTMCRDKAIAECQATTASTVATAAEKRQEITNQIKKISISERRKVLQRWVVK